MENDKQYYFTKSTIAKSFDNAAKTYDKNAVLQNIVGNRLYERLDLVLLEPGVILDLGSGTGAFTRLLQQRYKNKKVLGIDLASQMTVYANKQKKWLSKERYLCADGEHLPLTDNSVDLVFSNLMLQWIPDPEQLFFEMQRILVPGGLLMFSCYGPDTLKEIRQSLANTDKNIYMPQFIDMHDLGDSLTNAAFDGVVLDSEIITMTYDSLELLHEDLQYVGESNIIIDEQKTLTKKIVWQNYLQAYEIFRNKGGDYLGSWEINYGHAWATKKAPRCKMDSNSDLYYPELGLN